MTEAQINRYFIDLAYKGTNFHGWQLQPNALTVQEVLDEALSTVFREEINTTGCGRTDTGVHAKHFMAHFDTSKRICELDPEQSLQRLPDGELAHHRLLKSLNNMLGQDIVVKRFIAVQSKAHARFDALSRSYEYRILFRKNPFETDFAARMMRRPDIGLMNQGAAVLKEYTDFSCFSKSNTQTGTNNCKISAAEWFEDGEGMMFRITADRFLRNMVRAIVGTLLEVGAEELTIDSLRAVIESKNRSNAGESVPAQGLFLTEVVYPYAL